jgi:hypothetical protein
MGFLGDVGNAVGGAISGVDHLLNGTNNSPKDFEKDGFIVPPIPGADGNGLPSSKIRSQRGATVSRHIAHWFVPEVGVVPMYINPQSITYTERKAIQPERTKGGFIV